MTPIWDGPQHGFMAFGQGGLDGFQLMKKAASLGANVSRIQVNWIEIERVQGVWDPDNYLGSINTAVDAIRTDFNRPTFKVVPMFSRLPDWVHGRRTAGTYVNGNWVPFSDELGLKTFYTDTVSGLEQYAAALIKVLSALGNRVSHVELANEPNTIVSASSPAASGIPPLNMGAMAAYAAQWVKQCPATSTKSVIVGALDQLSQSPKWISGTPSQYITQTITSMNYGFLSFGLTQAAVDSLSQSVNISYHPYPGPNMTTAQSALGAVLQNYDSIASAVGSRKVWITEVGASSKTLGSQANQAAFFNDLNLHLMQRRPQIEGLILWPNGDLRDAPNTPWPGQFEEMGVFDMNWAAKPAASTIQTQWANWN